MFETLLKKFDSYKETFFKKYNKAYKDSFDVTKEVFQKGKNRLEMEKIKLELKKSYYILGKYIAKQRVSKGYSDFSLDQKFDELIEEVKKNIQYYKSIKEEDLDNKNNK